MEITEVFSSRGRVDVTFGDCILCLKCIEHCPEDRALRVDFMGLAIYRSSSRGFFSHPALAMQHNRPPATESCHE
jgi:formate hydrogenlyase subunit 6/NADH:ubiquinone oxidoreductase subunit I